MSGVDHKMRDSTVISKNSSEKPDGQEDSKESCKENIKFSNGCMNCNEEDLLTKEKHRPNKDELRKQKLEEFRGTFKPYDCDTGK